MMIKLLLLIENTQKFKIETKLIAITNSILLQYPNEIDMLHVYIGSQPNILYLGNIRLHKEFRGKGIGSDILNQLKKFADDNGLTIVIAPATQRGYKKKLELLYKKHGFIPNKGKYKDFRLSSIFVNTMYRRPNLDESFNSIIKWNAWWMNNNGKVFNIYDDNTRNHSAWARKFIKANKIRTSLAPTTYLKSKRWIRLTYNYFGDNVLHFDYSEPPTSHQFREIKKLAAREGIEYIHNDIRDIGMSI